jgi:hypothetical protein
MNSKFQQIEKNKNNNSTHFSFFVCVCLCLFVFVCVCFCLFLFVCLFVLFYLYHITMSDMARLSDTRIAKAFASLERITNTPSSTTNQPNGNSSGLQLAQSEIKAYDSYVNRVRTFLPSQWFAKPIQFSPLICALWGWECGGVDCLICTVCHAKFYYKDLAKKELNKDSTTTFQPQSVIEKSFPLNSFHISVCLWRDSPCPFLNSTIIGAVPDSIEMGLQRKLKFLPVDSTISNYLTLCLSSHFSNRTKSLLKLGESLPQISAKFLSSFESQLADLTAISLIECPSQSPRTPLHQLPPTTYFFELGISSPLPFTEPLKELNTSTDLITFVLALFGWNGILEESTSVRCKVCHVILKLSNYISFSNKNQQKRQTKIKRDDVATEVFTTTDHPKKRKRAVSETSIALCQSNDEIFKMKFNPQNEHRSYCPWSRPLKIQKNITENALEIPIEEWITLPAYSGWVVQLVSLHQCKRSPNDSSRSSRFASSLRTAELLTKISHIFGEENHTTAKKK